MKYLFHEFANKLIPRLNSSFRWDSTPWILKWEPQASNKSEIPDLKILTIDKLIKMMGKKYASAKQDQVEFALFIAQHTLSMWISKLERVHW